MLPLANWKVSGCISAVSGGIVFMLGVPASPASPVNWLRGVSGAGSAFDIKRSAAGSAVIGSPACGASRAPTAVSIWCCIWNGNGVVRSRAVCVPVVVVPSGIFPSVSSGGPTAITIWRSVSSANPGGTNPGGGGGGGGGGVGEGGRAGCGVGVEAGCANRAGCGVGVGSIAKVVVEGAGGVGRYSWSHLIQALCLSDVSWEPVFHFSQSKHFTFSHPWLSNRIANTLSSPYPSSRGPVVCNHMAAMAPEGRRFGSSNSGGLGLSQMWLHK